MLQLSWIPWVLGVLAALFTATGYVIYNVQTKKKARTWWICTAAFAVSLINNGLSWNGKWMSIVNPIILLVCHWSIGYLSREARKRRFPAPTT